MKTLLLKIENAIFSETEKILSSTSMPMNRYINEAIEKRKILEQKLSAESALVRAESLKVLKEFDKGYRQ